MSAAIRTRADAEAEERARLAPWAQKSGDSRGRIYREGEHAYRTAFARDRDRVVHSRAFRRLEYKTQVFVPHEGDHYRNRLTHTLEGAQIARTLARALRLNEDLAEAIALAHDLGHPPFGHAGERVLDELLGEDGGFDHNRQTLRIVDWLEDRYASFRGLNLSAETREGILKHGAHWPHPVPLPKRLASPSLEAQLADQADEIAYLNHDLDDGLRSGLLTDALLDHVPLWRATRAAVITHIGAASEAVLHAQTIVALINKLVTDLIDASAKRILASGCQSADAVRAQPKPLVAASSEVAAEQAELKRFLYERLYHHPRVVSSMEQAEATLGAIYRAYRHEPHKLLPPQVTARFLEEGEARAIADYIAGMTDRFALAEHERIEG
ncbi:MAG TPA: deoxyguanosinetriphosphate triphosphohydrolase [Myxococcota bacterium]|nr:deoxyguanosinetriphosphate triphosphohydrolase [Myxococcota bacterium]